MTEGQLHRAVVSHLEARGAPGLVWVHCNNNPRSAKDGARLKRMGLIAGVPDLFYFWDTVFFGHELKTHKGRLSSAQIEFHDRFRNAGGYIIVTYGLDDALRTLELGGFLRGVV